LSSFGLGSTGKPQITIQSPVAGSQYKEGDDVAVQSMSNDAAGIVRVELSVDGTIVRTDAPPIPKGQSVFNLVQTWKATSGAHTMSVRAYNASSVASDPVFVAISVMPATTRPQVSPTTLVIVPPIGAPTSILPTLPPTDATPAGTPTTRPTPKPTPSPTSSAPPGVYATSIKTAVDPKRGQFVTFKATFLNTTGVPQRYEWVVMPFYPDKKNPMGETFKKIDDIPVGVSELVSAEGWKVGGGGGCETFIGRVFYVDPANKQNKIEFTKPDGTGGPATEFQVCP
jgi:hypothetical protein